MIPNNFYVILLTLCESVYSFLDKFDFICVIGLVKQHMESINYHPQLKPIQREVRSHSVPMDRINKQENRFGGRFGHWNKLWASKEYYDSCNKRWSSEVRGRLAEIKELRKENHKLKSQIKNGIYEMRCAKCCKVLSDEIPGWNTAPDGFQYCDHCEM